MGKGRHPIKPVPPWFDCLRGSDNDSNVCMRGWIDIACCGSDDVGFPSARLGVFIWLEAPRRRPSRFVFSTHRHHGAARFYSWLMYAIVVLRRWGASNDVAMEIIITRELVQ